MRKSIRIVLAGVFVAAFILLLENTAAMKIYGDTGASYEPIEIETGSLNGNTISGRNTSGSGDNAKLDASASFFAAGYFGDTAGGMPRDGQYTTPGQKIPYKLVNGSENEAYYGKDSIWLTKSYTEHKMTLKTKGVYSNIYVLATAGGPGTPNYADFTVTLHYSDGSTGDYNYKLYDWYDNTAVANVEKDPCFRRRNVSNDTLDTGSSTTAGPYIQSATIACDSNKLLEAISYKITNADNYNDLNCGIFAITGATVAGVPQKPVMHSATAEGTNELFTFSATGASSYYIDIAEDENFKSLLSGYNNHEIPAAAITVGADGKLIYTTDNSSFPKGTNLYVRVRAKNDKGQSLSSNSVQFSLPHEHAITYSLSEDKTTILVGCSAQGECSVKSLGARAVLNAENATYSGNNYSGASCVPENWDYTLMSNISAIKYSGASYPESETPPKDAGEYKATVSVLDAANQPVTAEHLFSIIKKEPTASDFVYTAPENLEADGNNKSATVAVKDGIVGMGDYTVNYYRDGEETSVTAAPGTYEVVLKVSEGTNYTAADSISVGSFTVIEGSHSHDFTYSAKDNSLIANCKVGNCYLAGSKLVMTLTVGNKVYDGAPSSETITGVPDFKAYTGKNYKVDYYKAGSTDKLAAAPSNAGKYIAKMYLTDNETVVASTSFEITAMDLESLDVTDAGVPTVKANGEILTEGTDYKFTTDIKDGITKYSAEGIGNYKGLLTHEKTSVLGDGNIETTVVVDKSAADVKPSLSVPSEESAKELFKQAVRESESLSKEKKAEVISDIESSTVHRLTYDATVYVKLKDASQDLQEEEKEKISEQLKKEKKVENPQRVADLDVSLFMKYSVKDENGNVVDGSGESDLQLRETTDDEIITIEVPMEYRTTDKKRVFYVVRTHELKSGDVERKVIKSTTDYVITIYTNKFSTYSLFYSDPKPSGGGDEPGGGGDGGSGGQPSNNGIVVEKLPPAMLTMNYGFMSPKTGDTDEIYIMLALALAGIMIIGSGVIKNKRIRNK